MENKQPKLSPIEEKVNLILNRTATKNEALRRVRILNDFVNFRFFKMAKTTGLKEVVEAFIKETGRDDPRLVSDMKLFEEFGDNFFNSFDAQNITQQMRQLADLITKSKIILIYAAFEIPEDEYEKLGGWFKQNLGSTTLFDIIYDPTLIAGCALSFNGVYKDYSLKQRVQNNHQMIDQVISSYIKHA